MMATLVQLPTRRRPAGAQPVPPGGTADILLFTGIRYDRPQEPPGREQSPPEPDPLGRHARPS
jgi:hypothetical protein